MRCFHPSLVDVASKDGGTYRQQVRCGKCEGCLLERSRQWAVRCMHEAAMYEENCMVTLTYSPEELPMYGSLDKTDFQKFIKRLRKEIAPRRVRYFHCGEYGKLLGRPHYHALLFGFDFPDKARWTVRRGMPVWRSEMLETLWPVGQSEIGSVTFESAAYVARYCLKKRHGQAAKEHYERVAYDTGEIMTVDPEYISMSLKPGIGAPWLEKYGRDVYPSDEVIVRGKTMKPPRFYDGQYERVHPEMVARIKEARRLDRDRADDSPERLSVLEVCTKARSSQFTRSLEEE